MDSQTTIRALDSVTISSILVWEYHQALSALSCLNTVTLRWVPRHKGFEGNNKVDKLAKKRPGDSFHRSRAVCGTLMVNGQKFYAEPGQKITSTQTDGDSFLFKPLGKHLFGDPTA